MKNKINVKINKITTISICCVLFLCACFMGTFLTKKNKSVIALPSWINVPSDTTFLSTGNGTVTNPYKISSAQQLATVSKNIATYRTKSFKLICNINLADYTWMPIGTTNLNSFNGTFDGGGYSISGIRIEASLQFDYAGLFGYLYNATIKNLTMVDEINTYVVSKTSSSSSYAGALAGYAENSVFDNILNFNVDVYSLSSSVRSYAGGIVGQTYNTKFENVVNMGNVYSLTGNASNNAYAGGIVGYCYDNQLNYTRNDGVINSYYTKNFNSSIARLNSSSNNALGGSITPPGGDDTFSAKTFSGGIAGYCESNITLSYNTSKINAGLTTSTLSVAGENTYSVTLPTQSYAGGIVGYTKNQIINAYNLGNITSNAIETETTTHTMLPSDTFLNETELWRGRKSMAYYNTDLTNMNLLKPGQTKFYDKFPMLAEFQAFHQQTFQILTMMLKFLVERK